MIQNSQDKATVSQLKKVFATYSQAFELAVQENGTPDTWDIGDYGNTDKVQNIITNLAPYLKVTKTCTGAASNGCTVSPSWFLNHSQYDYTSDIMRRAELIDGSYLTVYSLKADCGVPYGPGALQHICGFMIMDINGAKLPNTNGKDIFWFYLTKDAIVPFGTASETANPFSSHCANKSTQDGLSCTAWVIYNENMDYLKCTGLAWGGQTTCN